MSDDKSIDKPHERAQLDTSDGGIAVPSSELSTATSLKNVKTHRGVSSSSERQIKFERAQKCLENAALVSKRIKEHRKATAELLGRPFEDDDGGDTASEMASTMSERTGYSVATDTSTTLSVQDALNIPGISESLANTLKQKELLMERIKQYKEITKRPIIKTSPVSRKESSHDSKKESKNNDVIVLQNTIKEKENALSVMQVKMKAMETTILDLQEKINEKDQIIEAKNKATFLMSDSLSKKEKDTLVLLEDTRQQMTKMQENFITMETEWKEEKQRLLKEIDAKDEKINNLEEANTILENSRFEISITNSKLAAELDLKNKEILELNEKISKLSKTHIEQTEPLQKIKDNDEEKGSLEIANMVELTKKIELLEELNCQIRQANKELENRLATINPESKSPTGSSPSKKGSPHTSRKCGRNTGLKAKSPWSKISSESLPQETEKKPNKNEVTKLEMLVQSLNKDILEKEYEISQKDALLFDYKSKLTQKDDTINELQKKINSSKESFDMIDIGISTEISEFPQIPVDQGIVSHTGIVKERSTTEDTSSNIIDIEEKLKAAQDQIALLNNEIEAANINMIKVKSNHKLKLKQMQKTIDNFSKVSDANAEIVKLSEELHRLSQKIAELEEEKGNLQLHLVDYDSGRLTESDVYKKMMEMENVAEMRLKAISVLEAQKFDLVQELHVLQQKNLEMEDKLADMSQLQNEQVSSEIKSVQLEEQIDELTASRKELELIIDNLKLDKEHLNENIRILQEEKEQLHHKLEHYIQENIELTDKLEKLSAEKVSSAESIEIVESLTTQEKLEIEEYNKGLIENKSEDGHTDEYNKVPIPHESSENVNTLLEESAELNRKIDLFTRERQEVMEKMTKISAENESLQEKITELNDYITTLQNNITTLNNDKSELQALNDDVTRQIEELKRERIEIMKEAVEINKPATMDDAGEVSSLEVQHDDKSVGDKSNNRNKSVKQLTKDILKLKNIIKEREAEIADCQMKILSLEEQQQKQNDLVQSNISFESKIKCLIEENNHLKEELEIVKKDKELEQQYLQFKEANELLQQEIQSVRQEYSTTISTRDARIKELENLLIEYEKQIFNYANTLQQKDKEMSDYINQITKLNDVSQKLKSTIDLLEEEKAKDQNAELVKSLNKQISIYQKKLAESEEKLRITEDEKTQLLSLKGALENKSMNLDIELKKMQETLAEKQTLIKELQMQQKRHTEEMSTKLLQAKERDEEIHEIKLQLRKESIENEKLRTDLSQKQKDAEVFIRELEITKENLNQLSVEKDQLNKQYIEVENKNKELLEKIKKFAVSIKKKSAMYAELENHLNETQKQLEVRNGQLEQLSIQVETLPALEEKLKHAEEEINRLQFQKVAIEQQKSCDVLQFQKEMKALDERLVEATNNSTSLQIELNSAREENINLKNQLDTLNNKLVEYEIEQKNSMNFVTKVTSLEADINQKQIYITELLEKIATQEQKLNQLQFGLDAKVQERDLYIESLETEINKYKTRICRLEETISVMEDRRHSLERKADHLGSQLQEKQKAYSEYTNQEDELVSRLAFLIDHDRVIEKQLCEIENENKELQSKIQRLTEENQRLHKSLSDIQDYCNTIVEKASKVDFAESEILKYQSQLRDLDAHVKRVTHENQALLIQKKRDIEEIELEFNAQIENAIKEKKALNEKYEKISEYVIQLEHKNQEYITNIQNLNINIEELDRINHELVEKSAVKEQTQLVDYTEQYVSEINKLNSIINSKNDVIYELNNKIKSLQTNNIDVFNLESKIKELTTKLQQSVEKIETLTNEVNSLSRINQNFEIMLLEKEDLIKQLMEKNKVTFEMSIPKTEGMIISSTIEALSEESKSVDISSVESQIVTDDTQLQVESEKSKSTPEQIEDSSRKTVSSELVQEPVIVPKKAYLCYKEEEDVPTESDPFNSEEGWGLGECEEAGDVTPGLSHLNEQILRLKKDNEALKASLDTSNTKLQKALKKLKEFKINNETLINELAISKQLSQSSVLDSAIEDELRRNIQELEKKIEVVNSELNKEKRDKDSLKKQNEVFRNANDRLTEMKERLENEIELWKYKFKEANDKLSTFQWEADPKDPSEQKPLKIDPNIEQTRFKDEIVKLEKENDELHSTVDQLSSQNVELLSQLANLKDEIANINKLIKQHTTCEKCEVLNKQLANLTNTNTESIENNKILQEKLNHIELKYNEMKQSYEKLQNDNTELQKVMQNNRELLNKNVVMEEELKNLKLEESHAKDKILSLESKLDSITSKLSSYEEQKPVDTLHSTENSALDLKHNAMENDCSELKRKLEDANNRILQLEADNEEFIRKSNDYIIQINELNSKIEKLNIENDQLLSNVAELRSSMTSAVDQRGFEIAELWKQHLTQREADFQRIEQELRAELKASETKYEQLLDNVQSSSQEETNKLIIMEQLSSLQNKLQDKEEHLHSLQDKYADVLSQLDILRSEMEDEKMLHESKVVGVQEDYEKQIQRLMTENLQSSEYVEGQRKNLQSELKLANEKNDNLNQQITQLNNVIKELETKVIDLENQIKMKDLEIHQKTQDYTISLTLRNEEFENVRKQLIECERKVEELTFEKESELAILRLKMHENGEHYGKLTKEYEAEKSSLTEELNSKIIECTSLNRQIVNLNQLLEEHSNRASEMQTALENQELEIVTLKDEISSLQDMLKSSSNKIEKHVTFASDTKQGFEVDSESGLNKELLDAVPRAELDLALYMLHQRDVRCEELTMELTQLLEERDTLQLRLSDSLRLYEELKSKYRSAGLDVSISSSQETISDLPSFTVEKEQQFVDTHRGQTSRSSSLSEPDGDKMKLQAKLSELRSVKQSHDVRLRQESEQRQLSTRLMQRDVAGLPPEAVDQLARAHHTLSRDSQSTPTVLLNWLRGKSTPKVVHM